MLVVLTHCHEQAGIQSVLSQSILYSLDRIGVPLFLIISGGLILPRLSTGNIFYFYKKRIPQFAILILFYTVLTNIIGISLNESMPTLDSITYTLINLNGIYPATSGYASHMWYMYTIIELYIVAPFLARMLSTSSTATIIAFVGACLLLAYVPNTLQDLFSQADLSFINRLGDDFTGGYVVYMVIGYLIMDRNIFDVKYHKSICAAAFAFILLGVFIMACEDLSRETTKNIYHWYSASLFVFFMSVCAAFIIKCTFDNKSFKFIKILSSYSFGVYLVHYAVLYIAKYIISMAYPLDNELTRVAVLFLAVIPVSLVVVMVMSKTRVGRYLSQ